VLFFKYNLNDQVKEDEVGRTCRTNEEGEEFCWEYQKYIDH
jgi:hypothetical protein